MTPEAERQISAWQKEVDGGAELTCVLSGDDRSAFFERFCRDLEKRSSNLKMTYQKGDEIDRLPYMQLGPSLVYHAIPEGPELGPFLKSLSILAGMPPQLSKAVSHRLAELKTPCSLTLFIAAQCPFCPKIVEQLLPVAMQSEWVKLKIVDGVFFPEMAEESDIQSAPTLILEGHMRWTGQTPLEEILDVMVAQDPSMMSAASMEMLLGDGKASALAEMMMGQQKIFPALYDLVTHEKWSVRLGAMVVMEDIIDQDPLLARQCVNPLRERFDRLDEQTKGDVVYILGEAGDREIIPYLERIASGDHSEDTREAAREALEKLNI